MQFDAIDLKILGEMQRDADRPIGEIAAAANLSSNACWRRIKRLEEEGVVTARVTLLDREKLGLAFEVYATVKLQLPTRENLERFESASRRWPEVVECSTVTGPSDYLMRIITTDIHAYDDFLRDKVLALGLVSDVQSSIVVRVAKRTTAVPLGLAAKN